MKNLLLYGTTNYGQKLSSSDLNKFKDNSSQLKLMNYNKCWGTT